MAYDDLEYEVFPGGYVHITGYTGRATALTLPGIMHDFIVVAICEDAFLNCKSLVSVVVPDPVKRIEYRAFCNCNSLAEVSLPQSLTEIGERAFEDCISLTSISLPDKLRFIGKNAFDGCTALTLTVHRNSYAHRWAIDNGIPHNIADQTARELERHSQEEGHNGDI